MITAVLGEIVRASGRKGVERLPLEAKALTGCVVAVRDALSLAETCSRGQHRARMEAAELEPPAARAALAMISNHGAEGRSPRLLDTNESRKP